MNVLYKVLKEEVLSIPEGVRKNKREREFEEEEELKRKKEKEERLRLSSSIHELEKTNLFQEYKVKDVQKDVQSRELIIREKEKQIEALLPLHQKNEQLITRINDLEDKLFAQVRLNRVLEDRIQRQVDDLGKVHQKRIEEARGNAMNTINEHVLILQILFQKYIIDPKAKEECLGAFVVSVDAIRTTVGINLI